MLTFRGRKDMNDKRLSIRLLALLFAVLIFSTLFLSSCSGSNDDECTVENLPTGKIGCLMGSLETVFLQDTYPEAEISYYNSLPDAIVGLKSGNVDYVSTTETNIALYTKRIDGIKKLDISYFPTQEAFCLNKNRVDLISQINGKIKEYKESGRIDEISKNWSDCTNYIVNEVPKRTEGPVIVVGTTGEMEPINFILNGELVGFDVEVIGNILYDLGYQVEYKTMAFGALLPAIESGKVDIGAADITVTEERKKSVAFSDVYIERCQSVIVRDEDNESISIAGIKEGLKNNLIKEARYKLILEGLKMTALLSITSLIFGTILGILLLFMKRSRFRLLSKTVSVYSVIIQGIPIVVLLMLVCYVFLGDVDASDIVVGMLTFGMFFSTGVLAALENGLNNIDKGQYEAVSALGYPRILGFRKIIFPQLTKNSLPVYRGEIIAMIKATAIAGYVAIQDLTKAGDLIRSRTFDAFIPIIIVAIIYFSIIWAITLFIRWFEKKDDRNRRKREVKL